MHSGGPFGERLNYNRTEVEVNKIYRTLLGNEVSQHSGTQLIDSRGSVRSWVLRRAHQSQLEIVCDCSYNLAFAREFCGGEGGLLGRL
jgi:hypothetical protein